MPRMYRSLLLGVSLSLLSVLAGCSGRSPSQNQGDIITVTSLSPSAGADLAPGSSVTFTLSVAYDLETASTGTLRLVLEDQSGNSLTPTQKTVTVAKGQGSVSLFDQVTLPATGVTAVQLFVSLAPGSSVTTNVVVSAIYPVG